MVSLTEQRGIEEMPSEVGEHGVRDSEVPLGVVVQAGHGADVSNEEEDEVIEGEGGNKSIPNSAEIMLDVEVVLVVDGWSFGGRSSGSTSFGSSSSSSSAIFGGSVSSSHNLPQDIHGGRGHC